MKAFTPDEVQTRLAELPGWHLNEGMLERTWRFADFNEAFGFLTRLALASERMDHHAEIWNVYSQVRIRLSTHDAQGITERDFKLARLLNAFTS